MPLWVLVQCKNIYSNFKIVFHEWFLLFKNVTICSLTITELREEKKPIQMNKKLYQYFFNRTSFGRYFVFIFLQWIIQMFRIALTRVNTLCSMHVAKPCRRCTLHPRTILFFNVSPSIIPHILKYLFSVFHPFVL